MPFVKLLTNAAPSDVEPKLAALLAEHTGKDGKWVMTSARFGERMTFGGSDAPCAYLEVKNLGGFSADAARALSAAIAELLETELGVPKERVYLEMADPPRELFGWNGKTFG